MTESTPRDRALAGEVVKVSTEMHRNLLSELIAARKEIEQLKAQLAPAVGFTDLPPRPTRPMRNLEITKATDKEIIQHYDMMLDYWIAEAHWQEKRADQLNAELTALMTDHVPRSRYDACNRDWLAAQNEYTRIAARAKDEIERLIARVAELEKERDASAEDARAMQERLQRAVQGAMTLRRALDIIVNIRPLGGPTYPECYSRMRAVALDALGDDGPPGPAHPPRVPGHNPVA